MICQVARGGLTRGSVSCIDASGDVIKFSGDVIASENISNDPYLIGKSSVYVSFDQIVVYAYLVDYYRYSIEPAFETDLYFCYCSIKLNLAFRPRCHAIRGVAFFIQRSCVDDTRL